MSAIHRQFLRFAIVGGGATAIHVVAALILYALAGLPPLAANLGGFMLAWTFSYFGHLVWTFARASAHGLAVPFALALFAIGVPFLAIAVMARPPSQARVLRAWRAAFVAKLGLP